MYRRPAVCLLVNTPVVTPVASSPVFVCVCVWGGALSHRPTVCTPAVVKVRLTHPGPAQTPTQLDPPTHPQTSPFLCVCVCVCVFVCVCVCNEKTGMSPPPPPIPTPSSPTGRRRCNRGKEGPYGTRARTRTGGQRQPDSQRAGCDRTRPDWARAIVERE